MSDKNKEIEDKKNAKGKEALDNPELLEEESQSWGEPPESFSEKVIYSKRRDFAKLDRDADAWLGIQRKYRKDIAKDDYSEEVRREYGQKKEEYKVALKSLFEERLRALKEKGDPSGEGEQKHKDEIVKEIVAVESAKLCNEKLIALMKEYPESLTDTVKEVQEEVVQRYGELPPEKKNEISLRLMGGSGHNASGLYGESISWFAFDAVYGDADIMDDKGGMKKEHHYDSSPSSVKEGTISQKRKDSNNKETRFEFSKLEFLYNENGDISGIDWDGDLVNFDWRDLMDHSSVAENDDFNISDAREIERILKEAKVYEQAVKKLNKERGLKPEEYRWLKRGLEEKINTLRSEYGQFLKMKEILSAFELKEPSHFYYGDEEEKEASKEVESAKPDHIEDEGIKNKKVEDMKSEEVKDEKDEGKKSISGFNFITPGEDPEPASSEEEVINPIALELFSENTEGDKKKTVESGSSESLEGSGDRKVEDVNGVPDRSVHELEGNEEPSVVFKPEKKELQKKPGIAPKPFFDPEDHNDVLFFERENTAGDSGESVDKGGHENYPEEEQGYEESYDSEYSSDNLPEVEEDAHVSETLDNEYGAERVKFSREIMEKFNIAEDPKNEKIVNYILSNIDSTDLEGESREAIIDLYFYNWNKENVPDSKVESTLVNLLEDSYAENKDFIQGVGDIHKDDNGNAIILLEKVGLSEVNKQKAEIVLYPTGVMSLKISQGENIEKVPLDEDNLKEVKKALHRFFEA
ncbi:MAG: hypothetical protein ACQESA_01495 [Patescibacteria group bacterium]